MPLFSTGYLSYQLLIDYYEFVSEYIMFGSDLAIYIGQKSFKTDWSRACSCASSDILFVLSVIFIDGVSLNLVAAKSTQILVDLSINLS